MAAVAGIRRLPGVSFETVAPVSPRVLPRMDVTAFVGFAASGPLHVPVAVEDDVEFEAIFGEDAPLAWDAARGQRELAQLAPAVRAYFRNGGRRAWVVRVAADDAEHAVLPAPGLVAAAPGALADARDARLTARSAGSWADDLRVATALGGTGVPLRSGSLRKLTFEVESRAPLVPGDLLRVRSERFTVHVVVATAEPAPGLARPGRTTMSITGDPSATLWLEEHLAPAGATGTATYLDGEGVEQSCPARLSQPATPERAVVEVGRPASAAPVPGTLVRVRLGGAHKRHVLWLRATRVGAAPDGLEVAGEPVWQRAEPPAKPPALHASATAEHLTLELRASRGAGRSWAIAGLGFDPRHPRYAGALPADEQLYDSGAGARPRLWDEAAAPRFPLAGGGVAGAVLHPIGIGAAPGIELARVQAGRPALERDGLGAVSSALFLDGELADTHLEALRAQADHLRWAAAVPRRLRGVHALMHVDEATLVCAPDLVTRGWEAAPATGVPAAPRSDPPPRVRAEGFADCGLHRLEPAPKLTLQPLESGGGIGLRWTAVEEPGVRYVLQEGTDPAGWDDAVTIHSGPELDIRLYGRTSGTRFYRVRAEAGPNVSAWSKGIAVADPARPEFLLREIGAYDPQMLLDVQVALLRVCAARADAMALLSLPRHYREDDAIAHAGRLRDAAEHRAAGFGALYHPWLVLSRRDRAESPREVAPDGPAAGVAAFRAATRGAWVAPANDPFEDAVALVHPVPRDRLAAMQDAQVNVLRQEPGGFMCLAEDTLVRDHEVRPINVRRLLSLVRRLALREGAAYVFEPNDPVFRRSVERGLGELMHTLHRFGAFAGRTPEQAFRVDAGSPPNTAHGIDQGRMVVELRLAPSRPLAFLLVRLVHSADRGLAVETP